MTKLLLHVIVLIFVLSTVGGCGKNENSEVMLKLRQADEIIETAPDSALTLITEIDTTTFATPHERAYYSMLLSMALDKNYIELQDFSVIQPAMDYYKDHGTPNERLRTYLYYGTIYINMDSLQRAVETLAAGLVKAKGATDTLSLARITQRLGILYSDISDYDRCLDALRTSGQYFKAAGHTLGYFHCLQARAENSCVLYPDSCRKFLDEAYTLLPSVPDEFKYRYFRTYIGYIAEVGTKEEIQKAADDYMATVPDPYRDYFALADAYNHLGDYEKMGECLQKANPKDKWEKLKYPVLMAMYQYNTGKYKEAYDSFQEYFSRYDINVAQEMRKDTRFEAERLTSSATIAEHESVIVVQKRSLALMTAVIILILGLLLLIVFKLRQTRRNARELMKRQEMAESERDSLEMIVDSLNAKKPDEKLLKQLIERRLSLLNDYLISSLSQNNVRKAKALERIEEITADKKQFADETTKIFATTHPDFMAMLKDRGLEEEEIQCCCLYAIGLRGNEVAELIGRRSIYNLNTDIKHKLGIDSGYLGRYLQDMLRKK